ncbi:MAG: hypothetical protein ACRCSO_09885 [Sphingomonas sp.]
MLARGDASALMIRAIEANARRQAASAVVTRAIAHRWASATFSGMRHEIQVMMTADAAAEAWLAQLPEAEFAVPGHLVADLIVDAIARDAGAMIATLSILTVEEG